jgi:hypothetical protein
LALTMGARFRIVLEVFLLIVVGSHSVLPQGPVVSRYDTAWRWIGSKESGTRFQWFLCSDLRTVGYEPCSGSYEVKVLSKTNEGFLFQIRCFSAHFLKPAI